MHLTTKDRILQFTDSKGINKKIFLKETNIKRGFLDKDKLKASVSDILLEKIIKRYPEINLLWLITGEGNMLKEEPGHIFGSKTKQETKNFNIVNPLGIYALDTDTISNHPLYKISNSADARVLIPHMPHCDAALYIHTDTMYPILQAGDIVCYKRICDINNIYWGEMYVMDISRKEEGDEDYLTLKYIHKSDLGDDYISLHSHNPVYTPQDVLKKNIKHLGLVKVGIRYNRVI